MSVIHVTSIEMVTFCFSFEGILSKSGRSEASNKITEYFKVFCIIFTYGFEIFLLRARMTRVVTSHQCGPFDPVFGVISGLSCC